MGLMKQSPLNKAIVIGVSSGGLQALKHIIPAIPEGYAIPILIVQHVRENSSDFLAEHLDELSKLHVKSVTDKEAVQLGSVYIAPAGYHLLVERDFTLSLSMDEKVSYSRPSVDVLFESAAQAYGAGLTGIVLTGANSDGTAGAKLVKRYGGTVLVQDPATADASMMPRSVLDANLADHIFDLDGVVDYLVSM